MTVMAVYFEVSSYQVTDDSNGCLLWKSAVTRLLMTVMAVYFEVSRDQVTDDSNGCLL